LPPVSGAAASRAMTGWPNGN